MLYLHCASDALIMAPDLNGGSMSQKESILAYLKRGFGITPLTALDKFGCFRLSERIRELEEMGVLIEHRWYRSGDKRLMSYYLTDRRRASS